MEMYSSGSWDMSFLPSTIQSKKSRSMIRDSRYELETRGTLRVTWTRFY